MFDNASPSLESSEVILSSTSKDKTYGEWMVVSRRKGKAHQGTLSLPLEKSSNGDVTSKEKVGELAFDAQPCRREGKRKILGPTPKPVTIPIDKYKKASPRKNGNGKSSSPKRRSAKSRGILAQLFGDPS